jgi:hypothetical protein
MVSRSVNRTEKSAHKDYTYTVVKKIGREIFYSIILSLLTLGTT